ncbi:MAG: hypothetical protein EHM65_02900 [Acidobacteriales bacterium]|nr:MAG: hypothetical protein EHM65_02900 [Terriglobales bacterium]
MPRIGLVVNILIATIVLTLLAAPAGAEITVKNNQADWLALTSGVLTIDFEDLAPNYAPFYIDYSSAEGVTLGGVNFMGVTGDASNYLRVVDPALGGNWNSGDFLMGGWEPGYIQATLPGEGSMAIAMDLMTNAAGRNVTVTLYNGNTELYSGAIATSALPTRTFVGFLSSDMPITSARFSAAGTFAEIDNFSISETPEPDSILFGLTGLAGLWLARRLRRR